MKDYRFNISTDFPNGVVFLPTFMEQTLLSSIETVLAYVASDGGECQVWFNEELSSADYTTLIGIKDSHTGEKTAIYGYRAPSNVLIGELEIVEDEEWQDIHGTVTNLAAFCKSADKAWGRCVGEAWVDGDDAQIQLIRESDGLACMAVPHAMSGEGSWQKFQFWAYQNQKDGHERYVLQARLNGATSFRVRDIAMSILEKER